MSHNEPTAPKGHELRTRPGAGGAARGIALFAVIVVLVALLAWWGGYFDGETDMPADPVRVEGPAPAN